MLFFCTFYQFSSGYARVADFPHAANRDDLFENRQCAGLEMERGFLALLGFVRISAGVRLGADSRDSKQVDKRTKRRGRPQRK